MSGSFGESFSEHGSRAAAEEAAVSEDHLLRAERIVAWFRWASLLLILLIVQTTQQPVALASFYPLILLAVLITAAVHLLIWKRIPVRPLAFLTTVADATLVGAL